MPIIEATIVEGRSEETVRSLMEALVAATTSSLGVAEGSVRVIVREVPATRWAVGHTTIAERDGDEAGRRRDPPGSTEP